MKSKWQFPFEAVGVYFEKAHHFNVRAKTETDCVVLEAAFAEHGAEVVIEPNPNSTGRPGTQRGYVRISLVGTPEATEAFAYWMASSISEHIAFQHRGQFRINYGFVAAERIPESPEEAASIGDGRHYVTVSSQEVDEGRPFDPAALTQLHMRSDTERILRQFNQARAAPALVDRFLGFFKTLELIYCGHIRGSDSLPCLRDSAELFHIAQGELIPTGGDAGRKITLQGFGSLLVDLVRVRGNCAHLRERSGYAPGDATLCSDVEPLVSIVEALAAEAIRRRLSTAVRGGTDE